MLQNKDGREGIWAEVSSELGFEGGEENGLETRSEEGVWSGNEVLWGHSEEEAQLQVPALVVVTAE